jgi:hypothetical protein
MWEEKFNEEEKKTYWEHKLTGEILDINPVLTLWEEKVDEEQKAFWQNKLSGEISWANPSLTLWEEKFYEEEV